MSYLDVRTEAVATAGANTAATSGGWQSLGSNVRAALTEAATAVREARVGGALEDFGADWNPKIERIAQQVTVVGGNTRAAAHTVHNADAHSASLLHAHGQSTEDSGSHLSRPITA